MASDPSSMQIKQDTESIFEAIVSNTPGLVWCFYLDAKDQIVITYLSDSCKALLGVDKEVLMQNPKLFLEMIAPDDLPEFLDKAKKSAMSMQVLNWEGRIWVEEWQDIKWINLRCSPRLLDNDLVQWQGFMTNITQSKLEKFEIAQSRKRLAELSAHMNHVKEEERKRISREIHDDVGGNLTAIKIGLSSIIKAIDKAQPELKQKAQNLEAIVDATFESVHRIASDLRPNILELGIIEALEWQTKEFEKQMGIRCAFKTNQPAVSLEPNQEAALYRICQEAMSNIAKHANASHVAVEVYAQPDSLTMTIADDGEGFSGEPELKPNAFGIKGMSERVTALDGTFTIQANNPKGTIIYIKLPLS